MLVLFYGSSERSTKIKHPLGRIWKTQQVYLLCSLALFKCGSKCFLGVWGQYHMLLFKPQNLGITFVVFVLGIIPYDSITLTKVIPEILECGDIAENQSNRSKTQIDRKICV